VLKQDLFAPGPGCRAPADWVLRGTSILLVLLSVSTASAGGRLGGLREDVRPSPSPSPPSPPAPSEPPPREVHHHHHHYNYDSDDEDTAGLYAVGGLFVFMGVTSPFWAPHSALGDDFAVDGSFPQRPYQCGSGYMISPTWPGCCELDFDRLRFTPRRWSGRLRADYGDDFGDLSRVGGHLLLSTTSRWGLDTEAYRFEENLPASASDQLWIGDCNLIFRFAQNERMQWRTGLGLNWMDDPAGTDFGFNFTYGVDYFPANPWILSATLDWGTLGSAELFHFRTTAGVVLLGIETYTGYEYYDIDRTQINSLIAGVRIWF